MSKITLKEFWNSEEKSAIHCDTEAKAEKLLKAFDKLGKTWIDGDNFADVNYWENYKENTCYTNDTGYCELNWVKKHSYAIYEFEDVIFEEEKHMNKAKLTLVFDLLRQCVDGEIDLNDLWNDKYLDLFYSALNATTKEDLIEIIYTMFDHISFHSDDISVMLEDLQDKDIISKDDEDTIGNEINGIDYNDEDIEDIDEIISDEELDELFKEIKENGNDY